MFEISMLYRDVRLLNTRLQYEWPILGGSACSVLKPIVVVREVDGKNNLSVQPLPMEEEEAYQGLV